MTRVVTCSSGLLCPAAAAAAKSLQSCPTLCDPIDGSPPGSSVPGILQARTLEWVAISFSNAWKWKGKVNRYVLLVGWFCCLEEMWAWEKSVNSPRWSPVTVGQGESNAGSWGPLVLPSFRLGELSCPERVRGDANRKQTQNTLKLGSEDSSSHPASHSYKLCAQPQVASIFWASVFSSSKGK